MTPVTIVYTDEAGFDVFLDNRILMSVDTSTSYWTTEHVVDVIKHGILNFHPDAHFTEEWE